MECERDLDLKTSGVSIYPLLDSGMGFGDEAKKACFVLFGANTITSLSLSST